MEILYEDADLLAVDKPAGMVTTPAAGHPPSLLSTLSATHSGLLAVHRLDEETTGVVLFARNEAAHRELSRQFEEHTVVKQYRAIVGSNPWWTRQTISAALLEDADRQHRTRPDPQNGKSARTDFQVLLRFAQTALIGASPQTGRTHQIRAHLAILGIAILGDALYAATLRPSQPPLARQRMLLHAHSIRFIHPATALDTTICAPLPADFAQTLTQQAGVRVSHGR